MRCRSLICNGDFAGEQNKKKFGAYVFLMSAAHGVTGGLK
jgi:hypothetical protein